jgi:2-amino-4-hydroxy-6-hydroxymethyldihydropteridine diphosphokinase
MRALIALGSNLGDRLALLRGAVSSLRAIGRVYQISGVWETAPMYVIDQPNFLNACLALDTDLAALDLLDELQAIERSAGRDRAVRFGPRTLDLDLLALQHVVLDHPRVVVPHPRMHERPFVMHPLAEVAPDWRHPVLGSTVAELAAALPAPVRLDALLTPSETTCD